MGAIHRLTPGTIKANAKKPGWYNDGGGLYLRVAAAAPDENGKPRTTQSWVFRYMLDGQAHYMGLGSIDTVTLADARDYAREKRKLLQDGIDPINARDAETEKRRLEQARTMSFKQCAVAYVKAHKSGWRNEKHGDQWESTLETYVYPTIGNLPVQDIDTALAMKVIQPIWTTIPETASRLRGRVEKILGWATTSGFRKGDNPARWRGNLENLLPPRAKVQRVTHHPALPYDEIGDFMAELRGEEGIAADALAFLIYTTTRTGETIGARWPEIDIDKKIWTIPAERMKADKEHVVPLSEAALAILERMAEQKRGEFVFRSPNSEKPLSNMAMLRLLQRMGRDEITVHGFRSTFRDWAAERTNFPREVAEMQLAHAISDDVEAAYRRGNLLAKRAQLIEAWARHCAAKKIAGNVAPMRRKADGRATA